MSIQHTVLTLMRDYGLVPSTFINTHSERISIVVIPPELGTWKIYNQEYWGIGNVLEASSGTTLKHFTLTCVSPF